MGKGRRAGIRNQGAGIGEPGTGNRKLETETESPRLWYTAALAPVKTSPLRSLFKSTDADLGVSRWVPRRVNHIALGFGLAVVLQACALRSPAAIDDQTPTAIRPSPRAATATIAFAATPTPSTDVTIWLSGSATDVAAFGRVVDAYLATHPGVTFHLVHFPEDDMLLALEGGSGASEPSILIGPSFWGPDLLRAGLIVELPGQSPEVPQGVMPLAWQAVIYAEGVIGVPLSPVGNVWYRHRGIAPEAPASLETWVRQAIAVRSPLNVGAALDLGYDVVAPWLWACDGFVRASGDQLEVDLDAGLCWARLLARVRRVGLLTQNTDEDRIQFLAGRAGWLIDNSAAIVDIQDTLGKELIRVDPWPVYAATGRTLPGFVWTEAGFLAASNRDEEQQAALAFLDYLTGIEAQTILLDAPGTSWLTVRLDLAIQDPWKADLLGALRAGVARPMVAGMPVEVEILERAVRAVVLQGTNPALAWQSALESLRQLVAPTAP